MPITPFLNGEKFDLETTRIMGVALEMACLGLRTGDCADDVKQAIASNLATSSVAECCRPMRRRRRLRVRF
jgi:hypothetical protein